MRPEALASLRNGGATEGVSRRAFIWRADESKRLDNERQPVAVDIVDQAGAGEDAGEGVHAAAFGLTISGMVTLPLVSRTISVATERDGSLWP